MESERREVRQLSAEVARKIAAGEVIDRPAAIVRELMDNAVDSGASRIDVEIEEGGIELVRVTDNGCGMSKEDLASCARPHATSKIATEEDLLKLTTLGFRGEALASMAAVSRLEIRSGQWRMNASVTEDHVLTSASPVEGTVVQTQALFENFPARRVFLKRPASEASLCRTIFEEKVLPRADIAFSLSVNGEKKIVLDAGESLKSRFCRAMGFEEDEQLFYEIRKEDSDGQWSFTLIIGEPIVNRSSRKNIYTYVNGRRIQEFSLMQAVEYGTQGYFPNGTHPVAVLFVSMDPSQVDFNIHPAKREARFKDISSLHHGVSSATKEFFRQYTMRTMRSDAADDTQTLAQLSLDDGEEETPSYTTNHTAHTMSAQIFSGRSPSVHDAPAHIPSVHRPPEQRIPLGRSGTADARSRMLASMSVASPDAQEEDASIEGRATKPNYLPQHGTGIGSVPYVDDKEFHFVGSTLGTFLIAEKNDVLYIIDQHAAHERYLYDKIMESAGERQELLVPYTLRTESKSEDAYLEAICDNLAECGYECKKKEDGVWEFYTVPVRWKGSEDDLRKDLLDKRINPKDLIHSVAASTACRTAVMDGTVLDPATAAWIAKEALNLKDPHCPHGRPVFTTITRKQLFSLVKRI